MAHRKRNWMWRRLQESGGQAQPRRVELRGDPAMRQSRQQAPHPTTPAAERFEAMTLRKFNGKDYCVVFRGGDTFRVDEKTITTPARFYWEMVNGEKLRHDEVLRRGCKTPRCVKHKRRQNDRDKSTL